MDEKPQTAASEVVQQTIGDQENAKLEATKENSPTSVFVNSEPIREEQVQNAVKFLSHPKVRGSPVIYRRSFLERKGLTKEEIDEAFRRVPDSPPAVSTAQPAVSNPDVQLKSSANNQPQGQPTAPAPAISKMGVLSPSRYHWSQALLAIGLLAVSGAGTAVVFKKAVIPRLKSWVRKVVLDEEEDLVKKTKSRPSLSDEATAAAKAAAAAAADVARASQEMLVSKTEEKRYFGELMNLLEVQVQEMKSMSNAIRKLEGQSDLPGRDDNRVSVSNSRPSYVNGKADFDSRSVRSLSPPAAVEPSVAPHPKSYMEIMAMIQRGERPPNIRDINDQPPNPNQPVSNPRLNPRPKPWEVGQVQSSSHQDNGAVHHLNGDSSAPWWQQKNARITEIETEDENRTGSFGVPSYEHPPVQRSWVPPQPPPVAMPEAAVAIRQPKKTAFQQEQLTDEQLLARSTETTDELQRVTKISESGGVIEEANGESSVLVPNTSELQKEDKYTYL